jgi:hypothetical protein
MSDKAYQKKRYVEERRRRIRRSHGQMDATRSCKPLYLPASLADVRGRGKETNSALIRLANNPIL